MKANHCFHSHLPHVHPDHEVFLHAGFQRYKLERHTDETRRQMKNAVPGLSRVPDEHLTHYAEGVKMHARNLTAYWYMSGPRGARPEEMELTGFGIHFPSQTAAASMPPAASQTAAPQGNGTLVDRDGHEITGYHAVALSMIFTHPEIMNLKPDVAALVRNIILNSIYFEDAVTGIQALANIPNGKGFANVALKENVVDFDGNPVYLTVTNPDGTKSRGAQRTYYIYTPEAQDAIRTPMLRILQAVKNDPQLKGYNWRVFGGTATDVRDFAAAPKPAPKLKAAAPAAMAAAAAPMKVQFAHEGPQAGVAFKLTQNSSADRTFGFTVTNEFLRYVSVYVQFLRSTQDKQGNLAYEVIPMTDNAAFDLNNDDQQYYKIPINALKLQTDNSRFIRMIDPVPTFLAIPTANVTESFQLKMPASADTVRVMAGGGFGFFYPSDLKMLIDQDDATLTVAPALILTGIVNLAVPAIMLAASTGDDGTAESAIKKLWKKTELSRKVLTAGYQLVKGLYQVSRQGKSSAELLGDVGTMLVGLTTSTVEIMTIISAAIAKDAAEEALPLAGQVLQAVNITAAAASLAETTAELLASPLVVENNVSLTIDTAVTVKPDPLDASGFPATAYYYDMIVKYDKGLTRVLQNLPVNRDGIDTAPITQTFTDLPGAGTFTVTTEFYARNPDGSANRLNPVGVGTSAVIDATQEGARSVSITIKELVPPLTESTTYSQKRLLTFQEGAHVWNANALVPTATRFDLNPSQGAHALSELVNINFSQTTGLLGYAWRASGQKVPLHGSGFDPQDDNFYTFQNIGSQHSPQTGFAFSGEGFTAPILVAYELLPPERPDAEQIRQNPNPADPRWKQLGLTRPPYNFFLQPDPGAKRTYVRAISLDGPQPAIDLNQAQSYGYFPLNENISIDGIAIHPSGYLVAIARQQSRLFFLPLPAQALPDDQAPMAAFASGKGDRIGLLQDPVAVGCTEQGAVLVLDAGTNSVKAFDYRGNPLMTYFTAGGTASNAVALNRQAAQETVLDMAVERRGFLYVLVYSGKGDQPADYRLDLYKPDGSFLVSATREQPVPAGRLAVDYFRNVYGLTFQAFAGPGGRTEPAVTHLIPSIPSDKQITR